VEVLVDTVSPPRPHDHEAAAVDAPPADGSSASRLSGRTRGNKLVHLIGDPTLVGQAVTVSIEHAGPYALRGALVGT
jgi:hypothetical protein